MPNSKHDQRKYPVNPYLEPGPEDKKVTFLCKYFNKWAGTDEDDDAPGAWEIENIALAKFEVSWSLLLDALFEDKDDDTDAQGILNFYQSRRRELCDHALRTINSILDNKTYSVQHKDSQKLICMKWRLFKINDEIKYSYWDKRLAESALSMESKKINDLKDLIVFYNEHKDKQYVTMRRNPCSDRLFFNQNYTRTKINFIEYCRMQAAELLSTITNDKITPELLANLEKTIFDSAHSLKGVNDNSDSMRYFNDYKGANIICQSVIPANP